MVNAPVPIALLLPDAASVFAINVPPAAVCHRYKLLAALPNVKEPAQSSTVQLRH